MAFANRSLKGSSRLRKKKKTCKTVPSVDLKASNHLKGTVQSRASRGAWRACAGVSLPQLVSL